MTGELSRTRSGMAPHRRCTAGVAAVACVAALTAAPVNADQPLWEVGAGLGGVSLPHYRGSEQSHQWLLPVPYVVYRGAIFVADEDGTRAVLLDADQVGLDISLGGSPPAKSSENRARAGMPDLLATVEIGPRLNLRLARGAGWELELRVPVRIGVTLRQPFRDLGITATPVLNLDLDVAGWDVGLQAGPIAGSQRFHAYFYDVDPAYATASRPAYRAGSGFAGWAATTSASRRLGPWWLAGYLRYDSVAGATFGGSPLVTRRDNLAFGLTASWIFKVSQERVPGRS